MALPDYAGMPEKTVYYGVRVLSGLVLLFLIAPILVIVPLSFNAEAFFTYPMPGLSLRWYLDFFGSAEWQRALYNSLFFGIATTLLSMFLGTLAALGLARPEFPWRGPVMALIISPMIVPLIIAAVGMFLFYADWGLVNTRLGMVLAHTALATPFVVITVTATLTGFDARLLRAAASLGANPVTTFRRVTLPMILPGMVSGGIFAFVTSFDEVVVALFLAGSEQRTLPRQMWSGIREQLSPTILAAATLLVLFSIAMLVTVEMLRRRSERLRGISQ
ncbi:MULTISPECIES: ABC transporter permease [Aquaspirillum]|uniref:ABC transporter permease n=1 Tax=Aquaspirillum serpens TaxID=190 RepID=UPI0003B44FEF|nr:ABC transporter permease [Aquaspirillum serpens]